jgi:hypothetical protein
MASQCSPMTWTIEEIERDWGATSALPGIVVDAFERVERILGREWIAATRERSGGHVRGPAPLLQVVSMGGRLSVLDAVEGQERLVRRLKQHDASAEAELTAMHLLHSRNRTAEIELEPDVVAGKSIRKADFRIRVPGEDWTYVEVTRPNISEAAERIRAILDRITDVVLEVKREFALEVFFRREPEDEEVEPLLARIRQLCVNERAEREEVDGLALLLLSDAPGRITPHQEPQGSATPRLCAAKVISGGAEPRRHIEARVPYADERADRFLRDEAAQLPRDHPGLIMVDASGEPTAFASWAPILSRRFQRNIHTRVSGLCLFAPQLLPMRDGLLWVPQVRLHVNPHAKLALPQWVQQALNEAARDFAVCFEAMQRPP